MTLVSGWKPVCLFACALFMAWMAATSAAAAEVTIAWTPNTEPDIAGYYVDYRAETAQEWTTLDAGLQTYFTFYALPEGQTFLFTVKAYSLSGLVSPPSETVSVRRDGVSTIDSNSDGLPDDYAARMGVPDARGDPDGDGLTTATEWHLGTDPTIPNTWQLAEGATGFFSERIALANQDAQPAEVSVTYLRPNDRPVWRDYTLPAFGRVTVDVNAIPELSATPLSAVVTTRRGAVAAERTMTWSSATGTGSHTAQGAPRPSSTWYFAEGSAGFFDTFVLIANNNASAALVSMTFLREGADPITRHYRIEGRSRFTVYANDIAGLTNTGFSVVLTSSQPVTAERAMYFGSWQGGHATAGTTAPATHWFLAEGRTGTFMDTFVLLANPNSEPVTVMVDYLMPDGVTSRRSYDVAPLSRATLYLNAIPELADTDVALSLAASAPIVVERSMYWPRGRWYEGHNTIGMTALGTRWLLAEGETGGGEQYATYVLVLNPGESDALVTLKLLRENGLPPVEVSSQVPARSRATFSAANLGLADWERFGVLLHATRPVAVERSMYWNGGGAFWGAGTNQIGLRLGE